MVRLLKSRRYAVLLTDAFLLAGPCARLDAQTIGRTISARIYDYDQTNAVQIRRAQREVTDAFSAAGVSIEWRDTIAPEEIGAGNGAWPNDGVATFTVVILKAGLVPWSGAPRDTAGFAPITRERGGRIAYVLGDRVRDIVAIGGAEPYEVLAGVITHEMAHLLMPGRRHGADGVLRAHWNPGEFRRSNLRQFSRDEVHALQGVVREMGSGGARIAD